MQRNVRGRWGRTWPCDTHGRHGRHHRSSDPKVQHEGLFSELTERGLGQNGMVSDGFLPGIKICGSERPGKYLTNTANT